ncbi:hypothetical protein CAEBREN_18438 [Caenorhabditis brenneri]|uniref:Uncharacterized protein n=1 Tax=Caenorhabditis brenneri TaxID=135651 RepID=G0N632_CAEBE|nr:hypothetical protein CAEBREN_18438 [Caenorhabditis brenneri]
MAYSPYYGTQTLGQQYNALGQQYNDDETFQLFFNGNLHHRHAQNQNDQVADGWGDFNPSLHQQKLFDIRTANNIDGNHSGSTMPQQNLNLEPTFNNRSGFIQGHPTPQWSFDPQGSGLLGFRCPEGPYQDLGYNQFAHQQRGHQHEERMMHQQFNGPNRPVDFRLHHPPEEQFINLGQVQTQQYPPYPDNNNGFVPADCNQIVPKQSNGQYTNFAGTHNQFQYVSGHNIGFGFGYQQTLFDGSAQEKLENPEKPIYQNLDQLNTQQTFGNNHPLRIEHMELQQMKESPRTEQLVVQMEQHNLLSPEQVNFHNNSPLVQTPQQLTHQQFQDAQNELLETDNQAEPVKPVKERRGNNEEDDQWEPMEEPEDEDYVPQNFFVPGQHSQQIPERQNPEIHVSYNQQQYGNNSGILFRQNQQSVLLNGSAHGVPGNNESDGNWMPMDTTDYNNQYPMPSTNSTLSVNFFMGNNEVPLPPVRVQKPKTPKGKNIPKVSTSRQTSLENWKRRESALQLSPAAKPPREFVERRRIKENTAEREKGRGYAKTYRDKQKTILEMAEKEKDEALEKVNELQETTLRKEKYAKFALKLLTIMGRATAEYEKDEENRYEEEKQEKIKMFEDLKKNNVAINDAGKAKSAAQEAFDIATDLVADGKANASKKTRAKKDLELKTHLHDKLVHDFDYEREIELQRLVHILLRHTCRPFLDPLFRYELQKKMQEHGILKHLPDFIEFIDSHSSLFKAPTEQEDKIK